MVLYVSVRFLADTSSDGIVPTETAANVRNNADVLNVLIRLATHIYAHSTASSLPTLLNAVWGRQTLDVYQHIDARGRRPHPILCPRASRSLAALM